MAKATRPIPDGYHTVTPFASPDEIAARAATAFGGGS